MKKIFFGMMAMVALVATSCQQDVDLGVQAGETTTVAFNLATPQIATKADFSDGTTATHLQYAVYDANQNILDHFTVTDGEIHTSTSVEFQLTTGNTYYVLFWAAAPNAPYTVDLAAKSMEVSYANATSSDENRDAFYYYDSFTVTSGMAPISAELRRPFAQLNIGTNDYDESTLAGYTVTAAKVTVPVYTTLNFSTGLAEGKQEVTFEYAAIPTSQTFPVAGYEYLAMNYLLMNKTKENVDVKFQYTNGTTAQAERTVGSVPVQRNHRTNLYGQLLTTDATVNVEIKPEYDDPAYNETPSVKVGGVTYGTIEAAVLAAEDGVATVVELASNIVVDEPVLVPAGKVVTLDLGGYTLSVADAVTSRAENVATYAINNHGTLTIKNGEVNARGIYNGYNPEGEPVATAKLTIENGTYNALGTNGGACVFNYGEVVINNGTFTSIGGYSLNTQSGSKMTINNATVTGGVYSVGELTINNGKIKTNRGGYTHAIYHAGDTLTIYAGEFEGNGNEVINANSSEALIYGGTFKKIEKTSYLLAGSKMVIYDGTFYAHESNPAGHPVRSDVTIMGGTFNYNVAQINKPKNCTVTENGDGSWSVSVNDYWQEGDNYYIATAAGLKWFADNVNTMEFYVNAAANIFDNKTVYLAKDIDLAGAEWTPIGDYAFSRTIFRGVFDGQGHTISNFKITQASSHTDKAGENPYGLFGNVTGTIKNLNVKGAIISIPNSYRFAAVLVGRLKEGALIDNCHIYNSEVSINHWQVGGIAGQVNDADIKNSSINNSTITGKAGVGAIAGFLMVAGDYTIENCAVKGCTVAQNGSLGDDYDTMFGLVAGAINNSSVVLNLNNNTVENNTIKGAASQTLVGYVEEGAKYYINGKLAVATVAELEKALKAGGEYVLANDLALTKTLAISNANFTLDGNGCTISQATECNNSIALFDITNGKVSFKNVVFDGIQTGAVIRTVYAESNFENVTAKNCNHTVSQGMFRLIGKATLSNCKFVGNECKTLITYCFDAEVDEPFVLNNCLIENNSCKEIGVVYYAGGSNATITNNKFVGNVTNVASNGATLYMGFTEGNVITGNLFQNNQFNTTSTNKRVTAGVHLGYATTFTGNAFVGNVLSAPNSANNGMGNDVCASIYYTSIDLSGNYWGGNAPVENENYYVEYPNSGNSVIVDSHLTTNPF